MFTSSLNKPPERVTRPADPGVYNLVLIILLMVPPMFPVLNAPGVIAPIVAGPIIVFLASLPSLDEVRSKLVSLINSPAKKIASVLVAPAGQLARLVFSQSKEIENSAQVLGKENVNG